MGSKCSGTVPSSTDRSQDDSTFFYGNRRVLVVFIYYYVVFYVILYYVILFVICILCYLLLYICIFVCIVVYYVVVYYVILLLLLLYGIFKFYCDKNSKNSLMYVVTLYININDSVSN